MSTIDRDTVTKIARLARIEVDDADKSTLAGELNQILGWVELLSEVDTENVPPMASVVNAKLDWRADLITDGDKKSDVLANTAHSEYDFYTVPKVIE